MAEYSARELLEGLPRLKTKQTIANEWKKIVSDDASMRGHVRQRGQTYYYDEVAAAELMRRLEPRFGGEPPEEPADAISLLREMVERQRAEIEGLRTARVADGEMYRLQIDGRDALIADLRSSLDAARADAAAAREDSSRARAELSRAREALAAVSTAGLFARPRKIAAAYLALPEGKRGEK